MSFANKDGAGGADVIRSGAGDDRIKVGDATFAHIDGGGGQDTLVLGDEFDLDLTGVTSHYIHGIEEIDMDNGLANLLALDFSSVLDIGGAIDRLTGESNLLVISGDHQDTLQLEGDWTERPDQPAAATGAGYTVYDSDDSDVSVAVQNSINIQSGGGGLA